MAKRTLESLQKQYARAVNDKRRGPGGPGPRRGPHGGGGSGKPKNTSATVRRLLSYVGKCRYADCAHVGEGEDECAVAKAAAEGKIPATRLESYRSIYRTLKNKNIYE